MTIDQQGMGILDMQAGYQGEHRMETPGFADPSAMGLTSSGLKTTERLLIEKTLIQMYPRLQRHDLAPWKWLNGPLIPNFIVSHTAPDLRRIVEIGCGDGVFSNVLSLLFPDIEIIGIDTDRENIAYARSTIGYRRNVKFICANATVLAEIPCDRIIYNRCLSQANSVYAFKKLVLKTSEWIVDEGDFIIKESPFALFGNPALLKALLPVVWKHKDLSACIRTILGDIGYLNPVIYQSQGTMGLPSELFYQVPRQLMPTDLAGGGLIRRTAAEWQDDWGAQSNDSLVTFLFSNAEADFTREFV
jgi:SAM-dependent methyltransferase